MQTRTSLTGNGPLHLWQRADNEINSNFCRSGRNLSSGKYRKRAIATRRRRSSESATDSCRASHTFDCNPDPTSVFDPSSDLRFGPGPASDSVPIRFYSRPVRNSLPHIAFNPDFATSHDSDQSLSIRYPILTQEASNALPSLLGLQVSTGGDNYMVTGSSQARLPIENGGNTVTVAKLSKFLLVLWRGEAGRRRRSRDLACRAPPYRLQALLTLSHPYSHASCDVSIDLLDLEFTARKRINTFAGNEAFTEPECLKQPHKTPKLSAASAGVDLNLPIFDFAQSEEVRLTLNLAYLLFSGLPVTEKGKSSKPKGTQLYEGSASSSNIRYVRIVQPVGVCPTFMQKLEESDRYKIELKQVKRYVGRERGAVAARRAAPDNNGEKPQFTVKLLRLVDDLGCFR
ncbi:hypothetical protein EVAR_17489_1 [Eumeta japonica]|uniref:Uncharacterized protein n=1 Tax=Eumeta variegata TaxID=151549 RepID=A0A4C1ZJQ0_EUMVA|nr:hypothetical protein EVAR_17489_1 [Eumeta japonica]